MSVFFTSQKTILKSWLDTSSTTSCLSSSSSFFFISQSRQLLDTWWIDRESSCLLDSFSTAGWSIELLFLIRYFCSSILSRHLHLSTSISSTPSSTDGSTPLSFENYWGSIHSFFAIQFSFLQSLSICSHLFISQTLSSHSYLVPQGFFKLFQFFSSLGKLLISHSSCISCFET